MSYPVTLQVAYPERLSRLTTFFRAFMVVPQAIVFSFVSLAAYVIMFLSWWAILFTAKYPSAFFRFITWYLRWDARLTGYSYLLTDKYPPFSGRVVPEYPVILDVEQPGKLSRLTTFFRFPILPTFGGAERGWHWQLWPPWLSSGFPMTLPHYILIVFNAIAAVVIMFLAWCAIVVTGKYPSVYFDFVTWWFRWCMRVTGYAYLVTDKYPPFSGRE